MTEPKLDIPAIETIRGLLKLIDEDYYDPYFREATERLQIPYVKFVMAVKDFLENRLIELEEGEI